LKSEIYKRLLIRSLNLS